MEVKPEKTVLNVFSQMEILFQDFMEILLEKFDSYHVFRAFFSNENPRQFKVQKKQIHSQ